MGCGVSQEAPPELTSSGKLAKKPGQVAPGQRRDQQLKQGNASLRLDERQAGQSNGKGAPKTMPMRLLVCGPNCKSCGNPKFCPCKREGLQCMPGENGCDCKGCSNNAFPEQVPFGFKYHIFLSVDGKDPALRAVTRRVNSALHRLGFLTWYDENTDEDRAKGHGGLVHSAPGKVAVSPGADRTSSGKSGFKRSPQSHGLENSAICLAFVTQSYIDNVGIAAGSPGAGGAQDVTTEFRLAVRDKKEHLISLFVLPPGSGVGLNDSTASVASTKSDAGANARASASKTMQGVNAYADAAKGSKYAFCLPPGPQHEWDTVVEVAATMKRLLMVMIMRREREMNITAKHQKLARIASARLPAVQAVPSS